jgi:hypothetical protein
VDPTNLADLYNLALLDWSRIEGRLDAGLTQAPETGGPNRHTCWLATITRVDDTGLALTSDFSAPSAGPPPWFVYRLTPNTATAVATVEPGGATRWRF